MVRVQSAAAYFMICKGEPGIARLPAERWDAGAGPGGESLVCP